MKKRLSSLLTMATILVLLVCAFTCTTVFASASAAEPDFYFTDEAVKWDAENGQFVVDFGGKNFDDGQMFRPYLKGYDPSEYSFKLDNDGDGKYTDTPGYFAFYDAGVYRFAAISNTSGKILAKSVLVINKVAYPGTAPTMNDIPLDARVSYYDGNVITPDTLYTLFESYFEFDRESVRISFSCPQTIKYAGTYQITASFEHDNYTLDTALKFEYKIIKTLVKAPTFTDYELNEQYTYSGEEYLLIDTTGKEYRSNGTNVVTDAGVHTVTLSLNDKDMYEWDTTGTSDDISYDFTINKAKYDMSLISFKDVEYVYDGTRKEIVYTGTLPEGTEVKYTAKLSNADVAEGQNFLTNVDYIEVTAEFYNNNYEFDALTATLTVTTRKVAAPIPDNRAYVYNTEEQEYKIPASIYYTVSGNKQTTAGTYTVTLSLDTDNCVWDDGTLEDKTYAFKIMRARYEPGPEFVGDSFKYDNEHHEPQLVGVPDGVSYVLSYEKLVANRYVNANEAITAGKYRITATFSGADEVNYLPLEPLVFEYEIYIEYVNTQFIKTDGNNATLLTVTCSLPVPDYLTLNVTDVTGAYKKVTLLDGSLANVLRAYDINFVGYGCVQTPDGSFLITLHVPDEILENENLRVAYINADGVAVVTEHRVENGVIVFKTEHFSVYSVIEVLESVVAADAGSNAWIFIVVAIVVVLLAGVVVFFILRRKSNGPKNTPVAEEPVLEEEPEVAIPEVEEIVPEEPVAEEPVAEEPVVEEPVVEEPVVEEPVVEEPVVEEPVVEEPKEAPKAEEDVESASANLVQVNGEVVEVHYRSSFLSRLIQSDSEMQDYYTVLKNTLLSYKEIKARTSWNFETFNKGRIKCAKINIKGKTLMVFLNLNPKDFNINKYHFADMSGNPKYDDAPLMMKIKSERSLKYTLELIGEMMKLFEIEQGEMPNVDYHMPYEDNEALAQRGLVKVTLSTGAKVDAATATTSVDVDQVLSRAKAQAAVADLLTHEKEVIEEPIFVDAVHADELITDTQAEELVIHVSETVDRVLEKTETEGKKVAINLDIICENFEDGEEVTLEALKARKLVSSTAASVKILARGVMTKQLVITANKYSLQAVKMIVLAGGKANLID